MHDIRYVHAIVYLPNACAYESIVLSTSSTVTPRPKGNVIMVSGIRFTTDSFTLHNLPDFPLTHSMAVDLQSYSRRPPSSHTTRHLNHRSTFTSTGVNSPRCPYLSTPPISRLFDSCSLIAKSSHGSGFLHYLFEGVISTWARIQHRPRRNLQHQEVLWPQGPRTIGA